MLFFHPKDEFTPGDRVFVEQLSKDGLPKAHDLYKDGFTTPEKCLEIDPNEFLKKKGVGPKTVSKLKKYQDEVKAKLNVKPNIKASNKKKTPKEDTWADRVLCEDESCVGTLNQEGICNVCNKKAK